MPEPRVLYFSVDNTFPTGGVRTIYLHVQHLVRNGIRAFVVQEAPGFRPPWFHEELPILYYRDGLRIEPDDVLVIPETHAELIERLRPAPVRKLVFVQNHFYIFTGLDRHFAWEDVGIGGVIASSDVIADFLQNQMGCPDVPVVHYAIDHRLFRPAAKKLQIAYMPRKLGAQMEFVREFSRRLLGRNVDVPWVAIKDCNEMGVARILGESAIFLSLSHLEGFGLPPVEAMASGCLVAGFHGFGGMEYASADNGLWCAEGDLIECGQKVARAVTMMREQDPEADRLVAGGIATAARYTFERQERELLAFFRGYLATG